MPESGVHVVTGAFGYSGKYITRRLLDRGRSVRTLTNSPQRKHEFGNRVEVHSFDFDNSEGLIASLRGADVRAGACAQTTLIGSRASAPEKICHSSWQGCALNSARSWPTYSMIPGYIQI